MNFTKLISTRKSIRDYHPNKKVEQKVLENILNAGRLAPSAANRQPWTLIVVSSEEWLEKIRPCYSKKWFYDAPHILIVKGNRANAWTRSDGYNALETDLTITMDHMILAAANEGVGTCWIAAFDKDILYKALSLKEDEEIFAITPLGYPKGDGNTRPKSRKSLDEIAIFL